MNYPDGTMTKQAKRIPNNRAQGAMIAPWLNPTLVARTVLFDGSNSGVRSIDSLGSILRVSAGPFSELDRMKAMICSSYVAYVVDTTSIYPGYGRNTRDIGDRVARHLQATTQVYLIHSSDDRFAKFEAQYIEARLIETAIRLGVPLANRVRPFGRDGLATSPDHEQLVLHALVLLSIAGFGRFEGAQHTQSDPSARTLAIGNLHDVQVLDPEAMTIPTGAVRMRLACRDIRAEGITVDDRFHLLPGADYSYGDRPGLSEDNCQRRRAIEAMDILEPVPGSPGKVRLLVGLVCRSPAMAGKILSGTHIGNKVWHPQPAFDVGAQL
jgi:hypothetical protein